MEHTEVISSCRPALMGMLALLAMTAAASEDALRVDSPSKTVVTARLLGADPLASRAASAYLVRVDSVRSGALSARYASVGFGRVDRASRATFIDALEHDRPLELTLTSTGQDLVFEATAVRAVRAEPDPDPLPPPLLGSPKTREQDDAGPSTPSAATPGAPYEHQVLELVNQERLENGNLPPLKGQADLDAASELHSANMATRDFFAHCDLDTKKSPWQRMVDAGYNWSWAAENIAAAYSTPSAVVNGWMNSSGHRANILSDELRELGVGYYRQSPDSSNVRRDINPDCAADSFGNGPFYSYWTQNFGRRDTVYPVVIEREAWATSCPDVTLYVYGAGWAEEMRFSNDGIHWSSWQAYAPDAEWTLDESAFGVATVHVQLSKGVNVRQSSDTIELAGDYPTGASLVLANEIEPGTANHASCGSITAHDYSVTASGDVTFTARRISLGAGFSVAAGGQFRAGRP